MNFLQKINNYVNRVVQNGDRIVLDVVLIDQYGAPIVPEFTDPDAPEITHSLNLTWFITNLETGHNTSYELGSGVSVINNSAGHVRLVVPAGELSSIKGFNHRLLGYYDDKENEETVLAVGKIDVITPGIDLLR
jgi:hypothetical protein